MSEAHTHTCRIVGVLICVTIIMCVSNRHIEDNILLTTI